MHDSPCSLVVFRLGWQSFGVRLSSVERLVRAVEVTPLPGAPGIVDGVINMQRRIIPVVNLRRRLGLPERELDWDHHLIIAQVASRRVALAVDRVVEVLGETAAVVVPFEEIVPGVEYLSGVARLRDGMLFLHDLDRFLSLDERTALEDAMAEPRAYDHP